jgi:hypothetical protein
VIVSAHNDDEALAARDSGVDKVSRQHHAVLRRKVMTTAGYSDPCDLGIVMA